MKIASKRILPLLCCLFFLLTGCMRYEVGVNFEDQHHGAIVQRISVGEQLTSFNQKETATWLDSVKHRAQKLGGKVNNSENSSLVVTIPFNNGRELVSKFNQFFNPNAFSSDVSTSEDEALNSDLLYSNVSLRQSNLLLWERDRFSLIADLRAFNPVSDEDVAIEPDALIDLEFVLNTPWGGRSIASREGFSPEAIASGKQLRWQLKPGQVNYIEAAFWLPSSLGLGTVAIILFGLVSFFLKYKRFPGINRQPKSSLVKADSQT